MKSMQEVLAEHKDWTDDYANKCSCRWQSYTEDAQTHQAAALAAAGYGPVREAGAQALRDAAEAWWLRDDVQDRFSAWSWLRARAARQEATP